MSKMNELSHAVIELKRCGEALISLSDSLSGMFSGSEAASPLEEIIKPIALEAVRSVLAEKSRAGFTAEVRLLLEKHGAAKLSEIDPANYAALLADAEVLGNG